jgi:hypothetical protein
VLGVAAYIEFVFACVRKMMARVVSKHVGAISELSALIKIKTDFK